MARQDTPEGRSDDMVERVTDAGTRAADAVGRAATHVELTRDELLAQGAELSSNVQKVGKNFSKALDKSVADQPMTTLGLAVAAGFVLGALWKA
ncbi:MAG: hypothetical protein J0H04_04750 [Hyphomicrobium denitrificans]|nr:hypothetical protein [Hyphomicrobium denitrificans]